MGLETKTYWLTDRQSQCDFDFDFTGQSSVGDSHEKFVVEEELEVGMWRLNMWIEGFICAVVQWYLECDSYSSCFKIRCQETDREIFAEELALFRSVTTSND
jgi:hypothetical protein